MNKEYFENKMKEIWNVHGGHLTDKEKAKLINITEQIYLAGFLAAQEKIAGAVDELIVNDPDGDAIEHNMAINESLAAIKSVKVEG